MQCFNVICGLPRAGSTLLCNILNQNDANHATDTSMVAGIVQSIIGSVSNQNELASHLHNDKGFHDRVSSATHAFIDDYYLDEGNVFDKGRGWNLMGLQFAELFPDGHMFVMVRDLRDVFASCEKQHRKSPLLCPDNIIGSANMRQRASDMCGVDGMIGTAVQGIIDLTNRNLKNVHFIAYEKLVTDPTGVLDIIYEVTGLDYSIEHDFDNVVDTSTDLDEAYANKFPHKGAGKVSPKSMGMWKEILDAETANLIHSTFPEYNTKFKYGG